MLAGVWQASLRPLDDLVAGHACSVIRFGAEVEGPVILHIADRVEFVAGGVRAALGMTVGRENGVEIWFVHNEDVRKVLESEYIEVRVRGLEVDVETVLGAGAHREGYRGCL